VSGVRLLRRLVLEGRESVADGSGGFAVTWVPLGTLWADVSVG
jgi:head-tail adaptor